MQSMSDFLMAMHARLQVTSGDNRMHVFDKAFMAMQTSLLHDSQIAIFDTQVVWVIAGGERDGVKQAIVGFGDPFADEIVWHVAVIANRDRVVAAVLPRIHGVVHDVAIDAGLGIIAQVTGTFCIDKRIDTQADEHPGRDGQANHGATNAATVLACRAVVIRRGRVFQRRRFVVARLVLRRSSHG